MITILYSWLEHDWSTHFYSMLPCSQYCHSTYSASLHGHRRRRNCTCSRWRDEISRRAQRGRRDTRQGKRRGARTSSHTTQVGLVSHASCQCYHFSHTRVSSRNSEQALLRPFSCNLFQYTHSFHYYKLVRPSQTKSVVVSVVLNRKFLSSGAVVVTILSIQVTVVMPPATEKRLSRLP